MFFKLPKQKSQLRRNVGRVLKIKKIKIKFKNLTKAHSSFCFSTLSQKMFHLFSQSSAYFPTQRKQKPLKETNVLYSQSLCRTVVAVSWNSGFCCLDTGVVCYLAVYLTMSAVNHCFGR